MHKYRFHEKGQTVQNCTFLFFIFIMFVIWREKKTQYEASQALETETLKNIYHSIKQLPIYIPHFNCHVLIP